jgi:D-alanyl-D-alanine carboxypeptidase
MTTDTARLRHGRRLALGLTVALTCVLATYDTSAAAPPAHPTATPATQLRQLVARDVRAGAPGVIVRVDDGSGQVIRIAEQADWSRRDHVLAEDDRFRMGSNTKTMVATVILQLVAEHRLTLTGSVDTWLPGLVPDGQHITLRMLLDHTSGLFDYLDDPAVLKAFSGQDTRVWTPDEVLAAAVAQPPLFAPGTRYSYSNTNYLVLGLIAEKVTGEGLADLVQRRIVQPLHLRDTYLVTGTDLRHDPTLAHGYEPDAARLAPLLPPGTPAGTAFVGPRRPDDYVDTTDVNLSAEWAAGGMVSSAEDWARFDTALMSGRLLPPAELAQMRTTVSEGPSTPNRYGLGLEQVVTPCGVVSGHDGQVPGYSTEDYTDSTGRRTASVFTSTIFGLANPTTGPADHAVLVAAVCAMLDKPVPTTATTSG